MKLAVIDIGTNTSRLAIFEVKSPRGYHIVYELNEITRLGEGIGVNGTINPAALERTVEAVKRFKETCDDYSVEKTVAIGTEALRKFSAGNTFQKALNDIGIEIEIISGTQECELVFMGALSGMSQSISSVITIDSGGGSTELARGGLDGPSECVSLELGAVRAAGTFLTHDPPLKSEVESLNAHCKKIYGTLSRLEEWSGFEACIGVAGTITTLAMMDLKLDRYDSAKVHNHVMKAESVRALESELMKMSNSERKSIPGMQPGRADIIHAGAALIRSFIDEFGIKEIIVSEHDIRYGLLMRDIKML